MATQAGTQPKTEVKETEQVSAVDRAVGASFVASGIGATVLGLMVIGAEASEGFATSLRWVGPVGPLSGKTGVSVIAFFLSWIILHYVFANRPVALKTATTIALVLIGLGLLFTFPPFFYLFAPAE